MRDANTDFIFPGRIHSSQSTSTSIELMTVRFSLIFEVKFAHDMLCVVLCDLPFSFTGIKMCLVTIECGWLCKKKIKMYPWKWHILLPDSI